MRILRRLSLLMFAASIAGLACSDESSEARRRLQELGLELVAKTWIVAEERQLREDLDALDPLVRRYRQAFDAARRMQAKNQSLKSAMKRRESGGGDRTSMLDLTGAGDSTPLQEAQIALVTARTEVILAVLSIRKTLGQMTARYRALEKDARIPGWLAQAGGGTRLGPARNYRNDARLAAAAAAGLASPAPVYREAGRFWTTLVVNDETPVAFAIALDEDQSWITANAAESIGVEEQSLQPGGEIRLGERRLAARQTELASIRLGRHTLRKVLVYVLPPEGEDLACRLSINAFGDTRPRINTEQWTLELDQ